LKGFPRNGGKILALTGVDIYTKDYNFIFGQSDCPGPVAVVSYYRLEDEDEDESHDDFIQRIKNVSLHESGHLHGLKHCDSDQCIMKFADCPEEVDEKTTEFCPKCQGKMRARVRAAQRRVRRR
jgi:archaemetzincin